MKPADQINAQTCAGLYGFLDVECVVPMTCVLDNREHAVTDSHVALVLDGRYTAICGHVVVSDSLTAPPGHPCRSCLTILNQKNSTERTPAGAAIRWKRAATRRILGNQVSTVSLFRRRFAYDRPHRTWAKFSAALSEEAGQWRDRDAQLATLGRTAVTGLDRGGGSVSSASAPAHVLVPRAARIRGM